MEHCLVYFSTSVGLLSEDALLAILEQSRHHNASSDITGALLYVRGSIIQVLEGEKDALEALYKRIRQDPRHKQVTRVLNRPISQRLFKQWAMGYETLTNQQLDDFMALVTATEREGATRDASDQNIIKMLKLFYDSNRRN